MALDAGRGRSCSWRGGARAGRDRSTPWKDVVPDARRGRGAGVRMVGRGWGGGRSAWKGVVLDSGRVLGWWGGAGGRSWGPEHLLEGRGSGLRAGRGGVYGGGAGLGRSPGLLAWGRRASWKGDVRDSGAGSGRGRWNDGHCLQVPEALTFWRWLCAYFPAEPLPPRDFLDQRQGFFTY